MNPTHTPGNEPDADDMSTEFDPQADVRSPATVPEPGEEEAAALGDFA